MNHDQSETVVESSVEESTTFMAPSEIAKILGVSTKMVANAVRDKLIRAKLFGNSVQEACLEDAQKLIHITEKKEFTHEFPKRGRKKNTVATPEGETANEADTAPTEEIVNVATETAEPDHKSKKKKS